MVENHYSAVGELMEKKLPGAGFETIRYNYNERGWLTSGQSAHFKFSISKALSGSYQYDENGNQTYDGLRGLSIGYNANNLPSQVSGGPSKAHYRYSTLGVKEGVEEGGFVKEYFGDVEYGNGLLSIVHTGEGRAVGGQGGVYVYEYSLRDHPGNTRVMLDQWQGSGRVIQEEEYSGFGLSYSRYVSGDRNMYLYNGKEEQQVLSKQYDYGARFYDPIIGRFTTIDPHSENYHPYSPYVYVGNNPIRRTDPTGRDWWDEVVVAMQHPVAAARIGTVSHGSTNISTNSARFAINTGLPENSAMEGSHINAYRHTLWQATIQGEFGETTAKMVGYAHENNPAAVTKVKDPSSTVFSGKNALSKADESADLLNNQIGREIGKANPDASMKDLAVATLGAFKETGLWTATKQADGTYKIEQTKLTDKQYNSALKTLQTTNNNGYTPQQQKERNDEVDKKYKY